MLMRKIICGQQCYERISPWHLVAKYLYNMVTSRSRVLSSFDRSSMRIVMFTPYLEKKHIFPQSTRMFVSLNKYCRENCNKSKEWFFLSMVKIACPLFRSSSPSSYSRVRKKVGPVIRFSSYFYFYFYCVLPTLFHYTSYG